MPKEHFNINIPNEGFTTLSSIEAESLRGFLQHFFADIRTNSPELFSALNKLGVEHIELTKGEVQ
jgi:hypothetical protein